MALSFKIFSLVVGIILLKLLANAESQITTSEKYYLPIATQKYNWYRAYQLCTVLGMQLASIETASDQESLRQYLFNNSLLSNTYWLAGNNLADRSEYVWLSSGKLFSYTKWALGEPSTTTSRCVRTNANFDWVSDACTNQHYFICSKPLVSDCGIYGECADNYIFDI